MGDGSAAGSQSGIPAYAKPGTPNAGTPEVRLALLSQLVAADRATVLPLDARVLAQAMGAAAEARIAGKLTDQEQAKGLRMNRISIQLAGNSHFSGWRSVVADDTQLVVVQSSAYKGKTVKIGWETWPNAAIVYFKKKAGLSHATYIDLAGKAGEEARLLAVRVGPGATFAVQVGANGDQLVEVKNTGGGNSIGGDPHWRDVKVKLADHPGTDSAPSLARFNHYQNDPYRGHATGMNSELEKYLVDSSGNLVADGRGYKSEKCILNANGFLGGDADTRFGTNVVTPM
jgi:hypothetical protein